MKSLSFWTLKNGLKISSAKLLLKCSSTEAQKYQVHVPIDQNESIQSFERLKRKAFFLPYLPKNKIKNLECITSVAVALNHVSWAKVMVPSLTVSNWNSFTLPNDFLGDITETDILKTAHIVKTKIPSSDLYIMESRPYRLTTYQNDICLRSMLVLLLSDLKNDSEDPNIIFQKPSLINCLHSLTIGGERKSITEVIKKKCLCKPEIATVEESAEKHSFFQYPKEKQESLSLALLIALTFLDVAVFQNPRSISKIKKGIKTFKKEFNTVNWNIIYTVNVSGEKYRGVSILLFIKKSSFDLN